jgi:hypothetical protein
VATHHLQHRVHQTGALLRPHRFQLRRERRQGLLGSLKLIWRGSTSFSLAATAMTVRSRLYANR